MEYRQTDPEQSRSDNTMKKHSKKVKINVLTIANCCACVVRYFEEVVGSSTGVSPGGDQVVNPANGTRHWPERGTVSLPVLNLTSHLNSTNVS